MNGFQDSDSDRDGPPGGRESSDFTNSSESALAGPAANNYLSPLSQSPLNNQQTDGFPIGLGSRVLLVLWSLFLCAGFSLAASLTPDARGYGTHESLGFPPCTFQVIFRIPCPSCGMTTSFAHFTRAEFLQSARANVAGFLLASVCLIQIPWCFYSAANGRLWKINQPLNLMLILVGGISAVAVINWCRQLWY